MLQPDARASTDIYLTRIGGRRTAVGGIPGMSRETLLRVVRAARAPQTSHLSAQVYQDYKDQGLVTHV